MGKFKAWLRSNRIRCEQDHVDVLAHALTEKAGLWYVKHVSCNPDEWSVDDIYDELYCYCFPVWFREETRRKLMKAQQKG
jgi:dihydroorotase